MNKINFKFEAGDLVRIKQHPDHKKRWDDELYGLVIQRKEINDYHFYEVQWFDEVLDRRWIADTDLELYTSDD
jgi:hypothetical protein